ncbi:hypothetical protein [uncultured Hyphomonas sp.]|jgi:hypothetical protein|uniref:hypothetical protein n=1 Tax=uncultured Hyphomonas sp. TaxID=225298 RepID=UPI0030D7CEFE|tara:strand:+ start:133 stop:438 length:306 start_codon:yes stop_codon:yes gene_type:complete
MRNTFIALGLLAPLMACEPTPPIVGGPCSYETSIITATVTEVDEDGALFEGPEGEFWVPGSYLGTLPTVGDTLTLKRDRITEGTCTPEMYEVVDADISDED